MSGKCPFSWFHRIQITVTGPSQLGKVFCLWSIWTNQVQGLHNQHFLEFLFSEILFCFCFLLFFPGYAIYELPCHNIMAGSTVQKNLDPKRLFHNLTAWFSGSVASRRKNLWCKYEDVFYACRQGQLSQYVHHLKL